MTPEEFQKHIMGKRYELSMLIQRTLPVKVGNMAKSHFQNNFRKSGFMDGSLQKWTVTKRQKEGGKQAGSQYGPLLSSRAHLMRNTRSVPGKAKVSIVNNTPYAGIHNEGGRINSKPRITPRMRKFAWAKFYGIAGKEKEGAVVPEDAMMWKRLALTKKQNLNITAVIPQRKFIGDSKLLKENVRKKINEEIQKILNK